MGNKNSSGGGSAATTMAPTRLRMSTAELWRTKAFADVEFTFADADDKLVLGHRCVLAMSSPLFAEFFLAAEASPLSAQRHALDKQRSLELLPSTATRVRVLVTGIAADAFTALLGACYSAHRRRTSSGAEKELIATFAMMAPDARCSSTERVELPLPAWMAKGRPRLVYCLGVDCPLAASGNAGGTDVYSSESLDCLCMKHSGAAWPHDGHAVCLDVTTQLYTAGSTRNGVTTYNAGPPNAKCYVPAERLLTDAEQFERCPVPLGGNAYLCVGLCHADPLRHGGPAWGSTGVYSARSHLCTAARHAGAITARSDSLQAFTAAPFRSTQPPDFLLGGASPVGDGCYALPMPRYYGDAVLIAGSAHSNECNFVRDNIWHCRGCGALNTVWGDGTDGKYTSDSNKCAAARHLGLFGPRGGYMRCRNLDEQLSNWHGSTRNGITTSPWTSAWQSMLLEPLPDEDLPASPTAPSLFILALSAALFYNVDINAAPPPLAAIINKWLLSGCLQPTW